MDTYPKVFTLYVEAHKSTVSFSYAELLTHELELELVPQIKKGAQGTRCIRCLPQENNI